MTNLNCPTCGIHLDAHEVGPCLNQWAAEIFGRPDHEWREMTGTEAERTFCVRCECCPDMVLDVTRCHGWEPAQRIGDTMLVLDRYPNVILSRCNYAAPAAMATIQLADLRSVCGKGDTLALAGLRAAMRAELEGK